MTKDFADISTTEKRRLLAELLQKKAGRPQTFPMSFSQERIWFLDQLQPGHPVFNIPLAVRLRGRLDTAALERTLSEIVKRHEVLRTTFAMVDGRPAQIISDDTTVRLPIADLTDVPEGERESAAFSLVNGHARRKFDLKTGPLFRPLLLKLGAEDHIVLVTIHHIVYDGWSRGILIREIVALYESFADGKPSPLPRLAIQYADYAVWQRRWLRGEVLERQVAYWRNRLEGVAMLELATDRPRPPIRTFHGAREQILLSQDVSEALRQLSRREGVTLFMTLLAAFKTMLHRFSGQRDLVVGSLIANRNRAEIEDLIGFFANTFMLRTDLSGNPTFKQVLKRVRETTLGAYAHQDLPFEKLVDDLHPERNLSHTPLFQVLFVLQNAPREQMRLRGLTLSPVPVDTEVSQFDLAFDMVEIQGVVAGTVDYNTDLFDGETVRRMIANYGTLLRAVVEDPDRRVSDLPILTERERGQLLFEWNDTQKEFSGPTCIHTLFEAQALRTPDRLAVAFENERVTYAELDQRATRLARGLKRLGVGPEIRVGICIRPSTEMIVALLGVLKAGGAYVPLDPQYPIERLAFMLADSQVQVILTEHELAALFPGYGGKVAYVNSGWDAAGDCDLDDEEAGKASADNLAYVIYTSGSTGNPKGVMLQHAGACNLAEAQIEAFQISSESRVLQFASLSFDASVSEVFTALLCGATLWLATKEALMPGRGLLDLMREHKITVITLPPSALAMLPEEELPDLKTLVVAGEACSADLVNRWSQGRLFLNAYGPTEVTVCATIGACAATDKTPSIGRAIANTRVYLLDQNLQLVPAGVAGELCIDSAGLARGYHNLPALTAEKFVPDPFSALAGNRLFRTGDLARHLPNGEIEFIGRIDNQVKLRGFRIEPGEVESALSQHPSVRDAVVTVIKRTSGDKRLVAYLTPSDKQAPEVSELRVFLQNRLPSFMLPSDFVVLESLPLTPNGKIDRRALPDPEGRRLELARTYFAPQTETEQVIAAIWQEVLKIDEVGLEDHFFDLGGHSLLLIEALGRIQAALGRDVSVIEMFQYPTISSLARHLDGEQSQPQPSKQSDDRASSRRNSAKEQRELRTRHRAGRAS